MASLCAPAAQLLGASGRFPLPGSFPALPAPLPTPNSPVLVWGLGLGGGENKMLGVQADTATGGQGVSAGR